MIAMDRPKQGASRQVSMSGTSDQRILTQAYERFGAEVYRYLSVMLGCHHCAEDVLQEVFMRLLRVARRDPAALQNRLYVLRVGRNEAYRALKKGRRRIQGTDGLLTFADPHTGLESDRLAIEEVLAGLPAEQREALQMKVYMSMTFEEIAELTGVSPNTAASRYRYAIEKMRSRLDGQEE